MFRNYPILRIFQIFMKLRSLHLVFFYQCGTNLKGYLQLKLLSSRDFLQLHVCWDDQIFVEIFIYEDRCHLQINHIYRMVWSRYKFETGGLQLFKNFYEDIGTVFQKEFQIDEKNVFMVSDIFTVGMCNAMILLWDWCSGSTFCWSGVERW